MTKTKCSDHELMSFLEEHYHYEVFMLSYALNKIIESKSVSNRNDEAFALEGFLLHARNLCEFYYHSSCKDYSRATDFIDKQVWYKVCPVKTVEIRKQETRINLELSHLTYKRISGGGLEKQWNCGQLYRDYLFITKCFLEHLPDRYFGDKLKQLKEEFQKTLSPQPQVKDNTKLSVATEINTPSLSDTACSTFPTT